MHLLGRHETLFSEVGGSGCPTEGALARGGSGDDEGSPRELQDRAGWRAPSGESQTCREAGMGDSDSQGQKQAGESGHVFLSRPSRCEDRALPAGKGAAHALLVPAGNPFGPALTERGARRRDGCCFLGKSVRPTGRGRKGHLRRVGRRTQMAHG